MLTFFRKKNKENRELKTNCLFFLNKKNWVSYFNRLICFKDKLNVECGILQYVNSLIQIKIKNSREDHVQNNLNMKSFIQSLL